MTTEEGMNALKAAELDLRKAVEVHGTHHVVVLEKLESYVALCRQHGANDQAEKLAQKAAILRAALASANAAAGSASPGAAAQVASAPAAAPVKTPAPAPAGLPPAQGVESAGTSAPSPAPEPAVASALAAAAHDETPEDRFVEKHLFNSKGEHIAVRFDGDLYSPVGKHLARWEEDLNAFIDDKGWYFGEIIDGDRLGRDPNWHYRHMNFGVKATAGSRSGWMRQPDTSRTMLSAPYEDIVFAEE